MTYLTLEVRLALGLPMTPSEEGKVYARQEQKKLLTDNRQMLADNRKTEIERMRQIVASQPTPPNGINGGPLLKWERANAEFFVPLVSNELGPMEAIAEGLLRLLASCHKGEPIPQGEWSTRRGGTPPEQQQEAIDEPPSLEGETWQDILSDNDNLPPMETIGNPLDEGGDEDWDSYENWN